MNVCLCHMKAHRIENKRKRDLEVLHSNNSTVFFNYIIKKKELCIVNTMFNYFKNTQYIHINNSD